MATTFANPTVLQSVPTEFEAALIVDALREHGIRAAAVGGHLAGYQAAAPGLVSIVVEAENAHRAAELLAQAKTSGSEIDWSQVDVGTDPDAADELQAADTLPAESPCDPAETAAAHDPAAQPVDVSATSSHVPYVVLMIVAILFLALTHCRSLTEAGVVVAAMALIAVPHLYRHPTGGCRFVLVWAIVCGAVAILAIVLLHALR